MKSQAWLAKHDLSLTFDPSGRLWTFRTTRGADGLQPVDARRTGDAIVLSVTVAGLKSGDVDLCARGDVLEIRGRSDGALGLACDVGMPIPVKLETIRTAYRDGVLEIRVPLAGSRDAEASESTPACMPVAV
jgi:HSP20 family molecular chaperone IbpA